jgi:hypothetical protein
MLHDNNKLIVLVIPPSLKVSLNENNEEKIETTSGFNKEDFDLLKDVVDYFSLMTYDYASHMGKKIFPFFFKYSYLMLF